MAPEPTRQILERIEADAQIPLPLRVIANSELCIRPFVSFANTLRNRTSLSADVLECMVMRASQLAGATPSIEEHQEYAAEAGLTREQIAAAIAGACGPPLTDEQQLGVALCDALHAGAIDEALWQRLSSAWPQQTLLDAIFSVAYWGGMIPVLFRGLGISTTSAEGVPAT
jgi:AhpD family alkylhydroperoxidase